MNRTHPADKEGTFCVKGEVVSLLRLAQEPLDHPRRSDSSSFIRHWQGGVWVAAAVGYGVGGRGDGG